MDNELVCRGRAMDKKSGVEEKVQVHPTAVVSPTAEIGAGSAIWHQAQVREGARLGRNCIVGKGAYLDFDVQIGHNVKIQNGASIYHGATVEDGVFVGPHACLTNDRLPRAVNPDGSLKGADDWAVGPILVREGASIGACAVVLPGVTIGRWAMIGAGAVVTRDVPDYGLVWGSPARLRGFVCPCGGRLQGDTETGGQEEREGEAVALRCLVCGMAVEVKKADCERVR